MELILVLRGLTLLSRLVLAAALVELWVRSGRALPTASRRVWGTAAVVCVLLALDNGMIEALIHLRASLSESAFLSVYYHEIYSATYLFNRLLVTLFPFALLSLVDRSWPGRLTLPLAALVMSVVVVFAMRGGVLSEWAALMAWNQVLTFVGILGYITFCVLSLLGRLPHVAVHLLVFVAIRAVFEVLLPIQEVIFRDLGRDASSQVWHVFQFLQFMTAAGQLAVVVALRRTLVSGRPLARVIVQ